MKKKITILLFTLISPVYAQDVSVQEVQDQQDAETQRKIYNSLFIRDIFQVGSFIIESSGEFNFLNVIGNANIGGSLNVQGSLTVNGVSISSSSGGSGGGGSGNVVGPSSPTTAGAVALFTDTTGKAIEQSAAPVTINPSTNDMANVNNLTITADLIIPSTNSNLSQGAIKQTGSTIFHTRNSNTAVGINALVSLNASTPGTSNTACGANALVNITTGNSNTGCGNHALQSETGGSLNTAVGDSALASSNGNSSNTAVGYTALGNFDTGNGNIAIGAAAGAALTTGSNNIYIGINPGVTNQSNTTYIRGIAGITTAVADAVPVLISASTAQLGTVSSSVRYKKNITSMESVIAALMKLHPVRFAYKIHDETVPLEYGLIAEEVSQIMPDMVIYKDGQPETVKYHLFSAILIKAIQELTLQNHAQQQINEQLMQRIAALENTKQTT